MFTLRAAGDTRGDGRAQAGSSEGEEFEETVNALFVVKGKEVIGTLMVNDTVIYAGLVLKCK